MFFSKIAGPFRIDSGDGEEKTYDLKGRPGGSLVKTLQYMIKVYDSTGANTQVGLDVEHGPDGEIYNTLKSGLIAFTAVPSSPVLLDGAIGRADTNNEVVGEWIKPVLKIKDSATTTAQYAIVEVWEMRKPF